MCSEGADTINSLRPPRMGLTLERNSNVTNKNSYLFLLDEILLQIVWIVQKNVIAYDQSNFQTLFLL